MKHLLWSLVGTVLVVLTSVGRASFAQEPASAPEIRLGPMIPVSPPGSGVHQLINRASTEAEGQVLMVCGERTSSRSNSDEGFVYVSYDAGRTWQETLVESSSRWSSEHSCALGIDGIAYFIAGVSNTDTGRPRHPFGRMFLYASNDRGRTWTTPTTGPFLDYTSITVDRTPGATRGRMYIVVNNVSDGRGGWLGPRPGMFTSTDGGRSLTGPVFPAPSPTFKRAAAFPGDSVVLDDGTVVTIFFGSRGEGQGFANVGNPATNRQNFVEAIRSTDHGQTVSEPTIVGKSPQTLNAPIAIDRKLKTLYTAWLDEVEGKRRVMLARSQDGGSTWLSSVAIEGDAENRMASIGAISIALNSKGVLGLVWPAEGGTCTRFAASQDQGRTFGKPIDLNPCEQSFHVSQPAYFDYLYSVPLVENALGRGNIEERGVSVRVAAADPTVLVGRPVLLVDGSGDFHPIWRDLREGLTQVWTRSVTVGDALKPSLNIEQLTDISKFATVRVTNNRFSSTSSTFYTDVALINSGADTICGPVRIVVSGLRSDYGAPEIDNADNDLRGAGAIWDMTDDLQGGVIRPRSTSMPRTLAFKIKNLVEKDKGNPVAVGFKIYGKIGPACGSSP